MTRRKLIALKGFDEELYRLVKAVATLEGKTVVSVIEEAVRAWLAARENLEEALAWARLEDEYEKNVKALRSLRSAEEGYALVAEGRIFGVFSNYREAAEKALKLAAPQALVVKLPFRGKVEEVELGLPW